MVVAYTESYFIRPSLEAEEFNFKVQCWVGWNYVAGTLLAVCVVWRASQNDLLPYTHLSHSLIPPFDYLTHSKGKHEWLISLHWRIKDLSIGKSTMIMDSDLTSFFRLDTIAFLKGLYLKLSWHISNYYMSWTNQHCFKYKSISFITANTVWDVP